MKEALIVLSLLGCDDSGTQCHYLHDADARYETLEACSAASSDLLKSEQSDYPSIVAVCTPEQQMAGEPIAPESPLEDAIEARQASAIETGYLQRLATAIADMTPEKETLTKSYDVAASAASRFGNAVIVGVKTAAGTVNPF